jgi:hypothetical protein
MEVNDENSNIKAFYYNSIIYFSAQFSGLGRRQGQRQK